ncbi:MAG: 6,7-dimethyl-8-ribityllumazine synthase [Planctomycetaceae bacterium]|nr:6,7-dimethyl-8-ribityllumazine synthase [Planctomycetota bacterium]NUN52969.1 6,7-dimethyl-8-ribityllumazine synthase [Planctomycetaceae bacterium]
MRTIEGNLLHGGRRFALVASRFNDFVTRRLVEGCADMLRRHGVDEDHLTLAWVPGSFELPVAARRLAASGEYAAVICLGTVIRGETSHYDLVCREAASGVAAVSRDTGVPCIFGVVTTDTLEQAIHRAGSKSGNKGADAALAALEMADLLPRLGGKG